MGEFDLIARYFTRPARRVALGVGDDCALIAPAPGCQLAVSTDLLVSGHHFFADVAPDALGHKALAVNLSDLAACGARPLAFTLALSLPDVNTDWLDGFARGLWALADAHGCELIGGDTTAGPLSLCITVMGEVPSGDALRRSGARAGDDVYVSGHLGDARLALQALLGQRTLPAPVLAAARPRLDRPSPRVALGLALRGVASAAIDLSDGMVGDLGHVLEASGVGASVDADACAACLACAQTIAADALALGPADALHTTDCWSLPLLERRALTLSGGDDYELLFTAPVALRSAVARAAAQACVRVTRVGRIDAEPGLRLHDAKGQPLPDRYASWDHFG